MADIYEYIPHFFSDYFSEIHSFLKDKCIRHPIRIKEKVYLSRRKSCRFSRIIDHHSSVIPTYKWETFPLLVEIKKKVEERLSQKFDYVLVHIYEDGTDYIGYHNDKEALTTTIASASFGATRKFRFRKMRETKGWDKEFSLSSGDLLVMYGPSDKKRGCQQMYKHSVPIERKIKSPRINFTFRQF